MKIAIINSVDFWSMGWTTDSKSQQSVISSLIRLGAWVDVFEVSCKPELELLLDTLAATDYLYWPNAYHVYTDTTCTRTDWLANALELRGLPLIGNSSAALQNVMNKDQCQQRLESFGAAIPSFIAIEQSDIANIEHRLFARQLEYPLFVKPNALSTSKGITQENVVDNHGELLKQIALVADVHGYPVMIEEYLPGQDITVSVFMTGEQPTILATYYDTKIYDDIGAVLDHSIRMRDWNDGKWLRVVTEPEVLEQIASTVIPACIATGINAYTRIDCRLDRAGKLKAFDVNGMPGLEMPFSTTVWQMIVKLQDKPQSEAFDTLISIIMLCATQHSDVPLPPQMQILAETFIHENQIAVTLPQYSTNSVAEAAYLQR